MMNITFLRKLTVVLVALFFASCDKDYNTLGSDIVGNGNFNFTTATPEVKVYNQKIPAIQTNNLPINQLGIYDNPVFGKTKANFVTQLTLATVAPTFNNLPTIVIDSVIVTVPYISTKGATDSSGKTEYTLNNIKGTGTINLQVFRNGFEMLDYDPSTGFTTSKRYFSDQDGDFNTAKMGPVLNDDLARPNENTTFTFSNKEYVKYKIDETLLVPLPKTDANIESRNSPRMRLHLKTSYFQTEIIDKAANPATSGSFVNNNAFKSYFKGLYFQVQDASSGTMTALDFTKGDVTIYYKQDKVAPATGREMKSLTLNISGNTVNLLDNTDSNTNYTNGIIASSTTTGQPNLFLKGGQGCMAFVELFTGTQGAALLTDLKEKNVLVNDATLTFTVDQTQSGMTGYTNPQRIYIFDADNNTPLFDYFFDNSTNPSDSKLNKPVHGGILETVGGKLIYKIRITEHVDKILKEKDGITKNVRLGVVVTENINLVAHAFLRNSIADPIPSNLDRKFDRLPVSSVLNTSGTILHGNNSHPDGVKFEVHYTKPN
ncbi:DUF4270 domain-containing protein [Flavobacterium sp.]|uniref:DUF4270 domain-containing protein n=1 Tax=Flavobacterium sp. TaxID=239 RepID=UPI00374DD861